MVRIARVKWALSPFTISDCGAFNNSDGQGTTLGLTAVKSTMLVARLGSGNGPIIACKWVEGFTVEQDNLGALVVNGATGVSTVTLKLRPYLPELIFHLQMLAGHGTFSGGVTSFESNSTTFQQVWDAGTSETIGVFKFEIDVPSEATTACHQVWVTQISSEPKQVGYSGFVNPTIFYVAVDDLVIGVNEIAALSITPTSSNSYNSYGPCDVDAGGLSWSPDCANPPYVTWDYGEDQVHGSTLLYGTVPGYYDVHIGGATFDKAVTLIKLDTQTVATTPADRTRKKQPPRRRERWLLVRRSVWASLWFSSRPAC